MLVEFYVKSCEDGQLGKWFDNNIEWKLGSSDKTKFSKDV